MPHLLTEVSFNDQSWVVLARNHRTRCILLSNFRTQIWVAVDEVVYG